MNTRIHNVAIARENEKIIQEGHYEAAGALFHFSHPLSLLAQAEIYEPESLEALNGRMDSSDFPVRQGRIAVAEGESFDFPGDMVLNFANAFTPGGGYLYGASSQEEALCRESTLYTSLSGNEALPYYARNRAEESRYGSDGILLSPHVEIFRRSAKENHALFGPPLGTAVITAPAVDLRGPAGNESPAAISTIRQRRMAHVLALSAFKGYHTLTLGAWGCGVFLNPPEDVASDFYEILVNQGYRRFFDCLTFAIYCPGDKRNLEAFREKFACALRA